MPRYEPYTPGLQDIYVDYAVLLDLQCAGCHQRFAVASCIPGVRVRWPTGTAIEVAEPAWSAWGDAPWYPDTDGFDMCAGVTVVADILAVREYSHHEEFTWPRHAAWEGTTPSEA